MHPTLSDVTAALSPRRARKTVDQRLHDLDERKHFELGEHAHRRLPAIRRPRQAKELIDPPHVRVGPDAHIDVASDCDEATIELNGLPRVLGGYRTPDVLPFD